MSPDRRASLSRGLPVGLMRSPMSTGFSPKTTVRA